MKEYLIYIQLRIFAYTYFCALIAALLNVAESRGGVRLNRSEQTEQYASSCQKCVYDVVLFTHSFTRVSVADSSNLLHLNVAE